MPDVVLDTHACLYALTDPARLGAAGRRLLKQGEAGRLVVWIPAAVVAEVVMLKELGRTLVGLPQLRTAMEEAASLRFLPLDLRQLDEFSALQAVRDPFDRLVISACRAVDGRLITRDARIEDTGLVRTAW